MSKKLWCTECWNSFRVDDDFSWENVECPDCGFVGEVVGRVLDGEEHYFQDEGEPESIAGSEAETELMPVVKLEREDGPGSGR